MRWTLLLASAPEEVGGRAPIVPSHNNPAIRNEPERRGGEIRNATLQKANPTPQKGDAALTAEKVTCLKESPGGSYSRWAMLLIALPFAVQAAATLRGLLVLIGIHNETPHGFPEGASVYGFLSAYQTHRFYHPPFDFPWNAQLFGPLFLMAGTLFAKLSHGNPDLTTVSMRVVSFVALAGSAAVIGCVSWRLERRKSWAAITTICALSCPWLTPFASVARPDLPAAFLALAAVGAYEISEERPQLFYLAGALGAAAVLTKQTTALALLALLIDCLWARRFRDAAKLIAGCGAVIIAVFVPLWLGREPVLANMTAMRYTIRDWQSVPGFLLETLRSNKNGVLAMAIALLGTAFRGKTRSTVPTFWWRSSPGSRTWRPSPTWERIITI